LRRHTQHKPYACDLCPKSYHRFGELRMHCQKVHNTEPEPRQCGGRRKFPQIDVEALKTEQNLRKLMRVAPIFPKRIEKDEDETVENVAD
jgi:hypothetical protein